MSTPKELRAILTERLTTNLCEWPDCEQPAAELAHIVSTGMGGRASAHTLGNVFMACATHARNSDGLQGEGQSLEDYQFAIADLVATLPYKDLADMTGDPYVWGWWHRFALKSHLLATRGWMETP